MLQRAPSPAARVRSERARRREQRRRRWTGTRRLLNVLDQIAKAAPNPWESFACFAAGCDARFSPSRLVGRAILKIFVRAWGSRDREGGIAPVGSLRHSEQIHSKSWSDQKARG